ncbi:MAG TPA: hypothetical protein DFK11_13490 [Lachnospiraceae bacterium]|jgi:hypothetical protein|nr:hypothetical protein [Lachnospiraceae bacterium]
MKMIFETVKFNLVLFFNSTRFIIPLLANVVFLFLMYYGNNGTYDISTVLFITAFFSFFLMLLVGNSIISLKNERLEQILLLRIGKYAESISELLFVAVLSLLVIMVSYGIPMIINLIGNECLIKQHLTMQNIICSLIIVWLSGIIGGVTGAFFNSNIIKDKKMVILNNCIIAVLTISKEAVIEQIQFAKYILFILPPLNEIVKCIETSSGAILSGQSCLLILKMVVYILVVCILKHIIFNKKLYD